ncbi:MAG: hypothetical protein ACYCPQ_09815 [Elusimicrobiota bacterium]
MSRKAWQETVETVTWAAHRGAAARASRSPQETIRTTDVFRTWTTSKARIRSGGTVTA